jgi:hypothetical protein
MPATLPADDPQPEPPVTPELEDCCQSGCSPCIFDIYDEALATYRIALAEWTERQKQREQLAVQTSRHSPDA